MSQLDLSHLSRKVSQSKKKNPKKVRIRIVVVSAANLGKVTAHVDLRIGSIKNQTESKEIHRWDHLLDIDPRTCTPLLLQASVHQKGLLKDCILGQVSVDILEELKHGDFVQKYFSLTPASQNSTTTAQSKLKIRIQRMILNPRRRLHVEIVQAESLAAADINGFSDPYVTVRCGRYTQKTDTVFKTLNPVWNHVLNLRVDRCDLHNFRAAVYDYDRWASDDYLGEVRLDISDLLSSEEGIDKWFDLSPDPEKKPSVHIRGRLHLKLQILYKDPTAETPDSPDVPEFAGGQSADSDSASDTEDDTASTTEPDPDDDSDAFGSDPVLPPPEGRRRRSRAKSSAPPAPTFMVTPPTPYHRSQQRTPPQDTPDLDLEGISLEGVGDADGDQDLHGETVRDSAHVVEAAHSVTDPDRPVASGNPACADRPGAKGQAGPSRRSVQGSTDSDSEVEEEEEGHMETRRWPEIAAKHAQAKRR